MKGCAGAAIAAIPKQVTAPTDDPCLTAMDIADVST